MYMMFNNKNGTIDYADFDVTKLIFEPVKENTKVSNNQLLSYPLYNGDILYGLQLPFIKIEEYGLPNLNTEKSAELYKTEESKLVFKLNINPKNKLEKIVYDIFEKLDEIYGDESMPAKLGLPALKKGKKWTYSECLKVPDLAEIADKQKKVKYTVPTLPSIKLKFDYEYDTKNITTVLYNSVIDKTDPNYNLIVDKTDPNPKGVRRIRTPISKSEIKFEDLLNIIKYRSAVRCTIRPQKLWASKSLEKYGITFKIIKMEIDSENTSGSSMRNKLNEYKRDSNTFIDDNAQMPVIEHFDNTTKAPTLSRQNEDDDDDVPVVKKQDTKSKLSTVNDDDDDEQPQVKKPELKKTVKKIQMDDDDDDEQPQVKKFEPKKTVKKIQMDDDDEDDAPLVITKKPGKK